MGRYDQPSDDSPYFEYDVREELDDYDRATSFERTADNQDGNEVLRLLPTCPPRQPAEDLHTYGARLLQFLIATGCTASLTDEELELADHISIYATAHHDVSQEAIAAISSVRMTIANILKYRRAQVPQAATVSQVEPSKPNTGPMAKLEPVPVVRPPSGQKARIDF